MCVRQIMRHATRAPGQDKFFRVCCVDADAGCCAIAGRGSPRGAEPLRWQWLIQAKAFLEEEVQEAKVMPLFRFQCSAAVCGGCVESW